MELNNTIATPLYKQLEEKLQKEIETGERPAGSRLPTENELSETYNVSRVTVRKALAGLSELGYLYRKSGKGTFVAEKKIQRGYHQWGFKLHRHVPYDECIPRCQDHENSPGGSH